MCGSNTSEINEIEFVVACNRYGVDNPTQTITRRLHFYGNDEHIMYQLAKSDEYG